MACRCMAWLFIVLLVILAILCAAFVIVPKDFFCIRDVRLTEIVSNITLVNGIRCKTLGTRLGYHSSELAPMADVKDLVQHWMYDQLNNGPDLGHGSLSKILEDKEYRINTVEVLAIHAFEVCSEITHRFSSAALYGAVMCFVIAGAIKILCLPPRESGQSSVNKSTVWERTVHARKSRIRTESEQTDCGSISHGIVIKTPIFSSTVTVNIGNGPPTARRRSLKQQFFSCILSDGEVEHVYTAKPDTEQDNATKRLFKKEFDGTLTRSSVQLVCEAMKSVGILFDDHARGTVVRIGSHFVITAWHVVKDIVYPPHRTLFEPRMLTQLLASDRVYVDFHEQTRQSPECMRFKLRPNIVFKDENLDIVILELDTSGKENHVPQPFLYFSDVFEQKEKMAPCVHIIGQHPDEENVVADFGCKVIDKNNKEVKQARKWMKNNMADLRKTAIRCQQNPADVDTAYHDVFDTQRRLIFNTYLDFGSSGGAVVVLLPGNKVALVAIVTHGLPPNYWYSMHSHNFPKNMRMEVGCTIKAILSSKAWKDSTQIQDQLFHPTPAVPEPQVEQMDVDGAIAASAEGPVAMETEESYPLEANQSTSDVAMETEHSDLLGTHRSETIF